MLRFLSLICIGLLVSCAQSVNDKSSALGRSEASEKNVYQLLQSQLGMDEFKPSRVEDVWKTDRGGDTAPAKIYFFISSNGKFQGKAYCGPQGTDCFSVDVYEYDKSGVNGFGKQVGIY